MPADLPSLSIRRVLQIALPVGGLLAIAYLVLGFHAYLVTGTFWRAVPSTLQDVVALLGSS